jgi:hypothetical protein
LEYDDVPVVGLGYNLGRGVTPHCDNTHVAIIGLWQMWCVFVCDIVGL